MKKLVRFYVGTGSFWYPVLPAMMRRSRPEGRGRCGGTKVGDAGGGRRRWRGQRGEGGSAGNLEAGIWQYVGRGQRARSST